MKEKMRSSSCCERLLPLDSKLAVPYLELRKDCPVTLIYLLCTYLKPSGWTTHLSQHLSVCIRCIRISRRNASVPPRQGSRWLRPMGHYNPSEGREAFWRRICGRVWQHCPANFNNSQCLFAALCNYASKSFILPPVMRSTPRCGEFAVSLHHLPQFYIRP